MRRRCPRDHAFQAVLAHQSLDGAPGRGKVLAPQLGVGPPGSVGLARGRMDAMYVPNGPFTAHAPGRLGPPTAGADARGEVGCVHGSPAGPLRARAYAAFGDADQGALGYQAADDA